MPTTANGVYYADASTPMSAETISATEATSVDGIIQTLIVNSRQVQTYVWANAAAKTAQTGMKEGDEGYQSDTDETYRYTGAVWQIRSKPLTPYTPTLSATVTAPTLGTGGSTSGAYQITDGAVRGTAEVFFGSAGAAQGSGTYLIGLPVPVTSPAGAAVIGSAYIRDASDGYKSYLGTTTRSESSASSASVAVGGFTFAGAGAPLIFTNNDQIFLNFHYTP